MSPGRRTNRKNLRSCQRTILLYSFYFFRQRKIAPCNYPVFNRVPPVHKRMTGFGANPQLVSRRLRARRGVQTSRLMGINGNPKGILFLACENHALPAPRKEFGVVRLCGDSRPGCPSSEARLFLYVPSNLFFPGAAPLFPAALFLPLPPPTMSAIVVFSRIFAAASRTARNTSYNAR